LRLRSRLRLLALAALCAATTADARQQPPPASAASPPAQAPTRTGRSYDSAARPRGSAAPAPRAPSPVTFTEGGARRGVTFRHAASPTSQKYLIETMGGGCALLDYDGDDRLDIFFTNGAALADPMPAGVRPEKRDPRFWNRLYRQQPSGDFEDVTERAGLRGEGYSMGAAAADYNNDGHTDLYVTGYGGTTLFRNRGDGTFEDVTRKTSAGVAGWSSSAGWLDYDRDGRLDLLVLRYMAWDFEVGSLFCGAPDLRAYCHPENFKGASNVLLRQMPDGTFEDVSTAAGVAGRAGKGLGVAFTDFDDDGRTDFFVANDSVPQSLYRNRGDGTFEETALAAGVGYDENGRTFAGMGVDAADYDHDGRTDFFVTALSNETYALFRNNGDGTFTYATNTSGVGRITATYAGWGTRFADFDNDGLADIFVAQGHVLDTIERASSHLTHRQTPLLMRNTGRGFADVSATAGPAFTVPLAARGAAFGDVDNDGDTDIVVSQTNGPPLLLFNEGTRNRWLGLRLVGRRSNRQGLGARVRVVDGAGAARVFDVTTAGSYLSASDPRLLVGLGASGSARAVEVRWPSGRTQRINNPRLNAYTTINEQ
jgi:hypothetical protein